MKHYADETPDQVQLTISTDLGFTADFLRELANAIENNNPFEDYETFRGVAKITWPPRIVWHMICSNIGNEV